MQPHVPEGQGRGMHPLGTRSASRVALGTPGNARALFSFFFLTTSPPPPALHPTHAYSPLPERPVDFPPNASHFLPQMPRRSFGSLRWSRGHG